MDPHHRKHLGLVGASRAKNLKLERVRPRRSKGRVEALIIGSFAVVGVVGKYDHTDVGDRDKDVVVLAISRNRMTELGGGVKLPVQGRFPMKL